MKHRIPVTSAFVAALLLGTLQIPSSAQIHENFSMAAGMSTAQITAMENSLLDAQAKAMASAKFISSYNMTRTTTKLEANGTTKCAAGGFIRTTMSMSIIGTVSAKPKVSISGSGHQLISDWKCVKGWIVNGDPSINRLITGGSFSYIDVRYYLSGGWKATGPSKQKQSCQTNGNWHYISIGRSGVSTIHISCVPGTKTDVTQHWTLSKSIPIPVL